ncbi:hypothetical protein SERLA73DRAFT_176127 [Serpula lacrymans var. lacrymans S7.3]|uniref:Beta-lactamase-related domain-containing protein n=1 Tax=Serpula lacrymans var. lacrymans (strain S7.3) TaxID=936435 RepID=F8PMD3_SERL3|nr:hypothetical protein SERLA73DRAFT_176127 [Serpula lacrymans var. lacrymans S7.3]
MAILSWLGLGLLTTPLALFKLNPYSYQQISFNRGSYEGHQRPVISPDLEAYIQQTLTKSNVPGLSLAIVPKDGEPEFRSWGNMTDDGEKTTPETLFHLASVSKAFVASSLGILIDDFANGRNTSALPPGLSQFTWKTKLRDILPDEWELMDEWASEKVNIHDILSHVTGMPRHDYSYGPNDTPIDVVRRLKHLRPAYELREKYSYNNQMFLVGAHIVSTYAKPYTQFVEERIFAPLGMTSTTFSPSQAAASGKFTQAWTKHGRLLPEWFNEDIAQLNAGPGAVISSTSDMSKWINMWLNSGIYMNKTIIPLSAFENITTAYSITFGKPENAKNSIGGYGMGWFRSSYQGHDVIYHTGSIPGFSTRVSVVQPSASQDGLGIIVFANADDKAETVANISDRVMEDALHIRGFSEAFD